MAEEIKQAQIDVKEFPECVRIRHGMYISDINQCVTEIVDNSTDEAVAGYCNNILIALTPSKGEILVQDDGRGIPVTPHPVYKDKSQVELVYTQLHAGGKFGGTAGYGNVKTGGLNGVGGSSVQALSEYMHVYVVTDNKKYQIDFKKGYVDKKVRCIEENTEDSRGTTVIFKPDDEIWKNDDPLDVKRLMKRLKQLSFLNKKLHYYFIEDTEKEDCETIDYYSENGLKDYVSYLIKGKKLIMETVGLNTTVNDITVEIGFVYTDNYSTDLYTFTNNMPNELKSDQVVGFNNGLIAAIKKYMKDYNINFDFKNEDVKEGLTAVIAIKVKDPNFEGQAKTILKMKSVREAVKNITESTVLEFLDKNPESAKIILDKIQVAAKARAAAQKARELTRKNKALIDNGNPSKLAECTSKNPEECEIFIVEGDSAGGSAKQGRNRKFQAILPVFGKILNCDKQRISKILSSEKIKMVVQALKCGIGEDFDIEKIRYHIIIIMADSDFDGYHIDVLWITFFWRYMRPVIEKGYLYIARPPKYKIVISKDKTIYASDDEDKDKKLKEFNNKYISITYLKGLGEMNADQLWETTMNPKNRDLYQITIKDAEECEKAISLCMSNETISLRRHWLMNDNLNDIDDIYNMNTDIDEEEFIEENEEIGDDE